MRRNLRLFALATLGTIALASSKEMSARSWLEQVPPIPNDAETAYRQWVDQDGSLKPGNEFKAVENGLLNVAKDQSAAALTSPQAQQQIAAAEQLKQQFGSPEGQAKLRAMSAEQLMALGQQMKQQQAPATSSAATSGDQRLASRIAIYPGTAGVEQHIQQIRAAQVSLEQQWQKDHDLLDHQKAQAQAALPLCHNDSGEPSGIAMRDLELKYSDLKISLATKYLPKFQALEQQMKATVLPVIDYGDSAMEAWSQLENAGLKQQLRSVAQGAQNAALGKVSVLQSFNQDASKQAAQSVADKKSIERVYAHAKGC